MHTTTQSESKMPITTKSDEQYRIQKMIDGKNGVTDEDALHELIDNGLDEDSKNITMVFNGGKLNKIHNDGKPMCEDNRQYCLTLDTRSKSKNRSKAVKGQYGIGGANSRAKLGGQGKEIITTKDGDITYQCTIDMEKLSDENISPERCWTGEHEHKPKWEEINGDNYKKGVTKEYIGDNLKQKFNLAETILHIAVKYNSYIKKGVNFTIIWDNKEYFVPDIYNDSDEEIDKKNIRIDMYDNNESWFHLNGKRYKCCRNKSGSFTCHNRQMKSEPVGNLLPNNINVTVSQPKKLPDIKAIMNYINMQPPDPKKEKDPKKKVKTETIWTHINNNTIALFKNIEVRDNKIVLNCGDNEISYDCDDPDNQGNIDNPILALMEKFIPDLRVNTDGYTLACINFDRNNSITGGDISIQRLTKTWLVDINFDSQNQIELSQENKNEIKLPDYLKVCINRIMNLINNDFSKKLDNAISETDKAKKREEKEAKEKAEAEAKAKAKADAEAKVKADAEAKAKAEAEVKTDAEAETEVKTDAEAETEVKTDAEAEVKTDAEAEVKTDSEAEVKTDAEAEVKTDAEAEVKTDAEAETEVKTDAEEKSERVKHNKTIKVNAYIKGSLSKSEAVKIFDKFMECFDDSIDCVEPFNSMNKYLDSKNIYIKEQ